MTVVETVELITLEAGIISEELVEVLLGPIEVVELGVDKSSEGPSEATGYDGFDDGASLEEFSLIELSAFENEDPLDEVGVTDVKAGPAEIVEIVPVDWIFGIVSVAKSDSVAEIDVEAEDAESIIELKADGTYEAELPELAAETEALENEFDSTGLTISVEVRVASESPDELLTIPELPAMDVTPVKLDSVPIVVVKAGSSVAVIISLKQVGHKPSLELLPTFEELDEKSADSDSLAAVVVIAGSSEVVTGPPVHVGHNGSFELAPISEELGEVIVVPIE